MEAYLRTINLNVLKEWQIILLFALAKLLIHFLTFSNYELHRDAYLDDAQIVSAIIQHATGKPTYIWADEVLITKIGISNYNWVRHKDGTTRGGFGIETTPRELGKIALCVANRGICNNQQIVPAEWITEITAPQVETSYGFSFGY